MENTAKIIFEKSLNNHFKVRIVKSNSQYIIEKSFQKDSLGQEIWLPIEENDKTTVFGIIGSFFEDYDSVEFKELDYLVSENIRLKESLKKVLALYYDKEDDCLDFYITGKGERVYREISMLLYRESSLDEEAIEELLKEYKHKL